MWRPQTRGCTRKEGACFLVMRGKPLSKWFLSVNRSYSTLSSYPPTILQVAMPSAPLNLNPQSAPTSRIPRLIHTQKLSSPAFATLCVATSCPWNLKLVRASPHSQPALWDTHNFQQLMANATKIQRLGSKALDGRGKTRHGSLAAPTPLGFGRISSEVSGVRNHL